MLINTKYTVNDHNQRPPVTTVCRYDLPANNVRKYATLVTSLVSEQLENTVITDQCIVSITYSIYIIYTIKSGQYRSATPGVWPSIPACQRHW